MQILSDQIMDSQAYMSVLPVIITVSEVCVPGDNWLVMGENSSVNVCISVN